MLSEELRREVRRLSFRTRRRVNTLLAGGYHSAFKGRGIEFAEVREYEPGDDVRVIDWNVTARVGRPFVKRFVEERELSVMLVVDRSASGWFTSAEKSKSRVGVELSAVVGMSAATNHDRVGLLLFTDRVERFLPPRRGRNHLLRVTRELLGFEPMGRGTDVGMALEHASKVLKRRSVVFVVSDFASADFERPLRALSRRHEVVAVRVEDPRERSLPAAGLVDLEDAEGGEVVTVDLGSARVRRAVEEGWRARRSALAGMFARAKVDVVEVSTERNFVDDLAGYFRRRERRR